MPKRDLYMDNYYFKEYKQNLLMLDKSPSTIYMYLDNIVIFIEWFDETNGISFDASIITPIDIRDFRSYLQNVKKQKVSTINLKIASLKSYFGFLYYSKYISKNPAETIKKIKDTSIHVAKSFDEKTYRAIRREIYRSDFPLHVALWETLAKTGCRCSELTNLRLSDINITERTAHITIRGKGNKYRTLKLHLDAKNTILNYLKIREKIKTDSEFLFLSERKQKFTRSAIWKIVNKYASKVGTHISVHQIRHYVLRKILVNSDLSTAAYVAGHSSPLVTSKIYTLPREEEKNAAIDKL